MAQQLINNGTGANDGTGDTLRQAADKINDNTTELYQQDSDLLGLIEALTLRVEALEA